MGKVTVDFSVSLGRLRQESERVTRAGKRVDIRPGLAAESQQRSYVDVIRPPHEEEGHGTQTR